MNPTPRRVTLFAFWGRRANVELQLPFIRRILDDHPQVDFHGWNLCRDPADDEYVRTVSGERIYIRNDFAGPRSYAKMFRVWQFYARPRDADRLFVKIDDDLGAWRDSPPDFVKELIKPGVRPQPYFKAILIAMAEATLVDRSVIITVVAHDPSDWTMRVKEIPS